MAEPPSRNNSLRIPRLRGNPSRNGSVRRTSAVINNDDYSSFQQQQQQRLPSGVFPSIRSVDSRYSLNEQFAATRQEYEFGDDDASSVFDRATIASEAAVPFDDIPEEHDLDDLIADDLLLPEAETHLARSDHYEVLCLSRAAVPSPDAIRDAYYRLFLLLCPDAYPDHLQPLARRYFHRVQQAFETLIEPRRRAAYDAALLVDGVSESYEDAYLDALRCAAADPLPPRLDIRPTPAGASAPPALALTLGHTVQLGVLALESFVQRTIPNLLLSAATDTEKPAPRIRLGKPTLAVTTTIHGLSPELLPRPWVLIPSPPAQAAPRAPEHKLARLFSLDCTEQAWKTSDDPASSDAAPTLTALPAGIITAHLSQPLLLPGAAGPTTLDATIASPALGAGAATGGLPLPAVSLGASHQLRSGTAFVRADSGQWLWSAPQGWPGAWASAGCRLLHWGASAAAAAGPAVEVGFSTEMAYANETTDAQAGLLGPGSWAVATTASAAAATGYLQYTQDFSLEPEPKPSRGVSHLSRVQAELCADTLRGAHLALRNLLPFGRFSAGGLELGLGRHGLHLSVHWSRLGHRLSLPVLLCPTALSSPRLVLCAGVMPLAAVSLLGLLRHHWRRWTTPRAPITTPYPPSPHLLQASVALRRTEADNLLTLLSPAVDARQRRAAAAGDLVVLDGKFGVRDSAGSWAAEEVADVTVALAALIARDGRLAVPAGVRKGNLLGFWDPAPGQDKTLVVRYLWRGREAMVEVRGDEELLLPPAEPPVPS
jgi:DnaJ family protein C protein 11